MDVFGQVAAKRREIEEATKMNIAKSFLENISTTTEVEEEKVEKSMNDELDEVHRELFGDTLGVDVSTIKAIKRSKNLTTGVSSLDKYIRDNF